MALTTGKNGKAHVFELSNRASVQKLSSQDIAGINGTMDNHMSGLNTNAHQIGNIAGLQVELDGKADVFTGFTGSLSVVTHVDFAGEIVTTKTITVNNGIIISVV